MILAALLLAVALAPQEAASAPPRARGWDEFPVLVWRERYAGKPLPPALAEPFGGTILMRAEDPAWARASGLATLVWNVAGRDALHLDADEAWNARVEAWIRTRDEALLVRTPCLNDPKTLEGLFATLETTLARHGEDPGLGFVLGDEVSLTPNGDPFDLCRCAFCEAKWRAHAAERGLPERAPLTDEVRQGLIEGDFSGLGAWLARRRFDQDQIQEVLSALLARCARDRGWGAGLLGCNDQTAFGGLALERLLGSLALVECYPGGGARELVGTEEDLGHHGVSEIPGQSFGPPLALTTLFVEPEPEAGLAWCVFDAWMRGDAGLVLWSDAQLEDLSEGARSRLTEALETIRTVTWTSAEEPPRPLRFSSRTDSVAIVRDADSTAVSFLRDALLDGPTWPRRRASYQREHGTLERRVQRWLRLLEDRGLRPGVLPLSAVCPRCTDPFDVLVLPEVLVVSDDDLRRLAGFVASGGWIVIDGTFGWVDRTGRPRGDEDLRARIAGAHPERVRVVAADTAGASRLVQDLPPLRARQERLSRMGFPRFTGAADIAWRMRTVSGSADELGLVLLPATLTPEERRARLADVSLEGVQAPDGFALEWILPPGGGTLRAGDAAVLRITPAH